jgi:hypothetical protein
LVTIGRNHPLAIILTVSSVVNESESDELYRPYDTLKAIGFTKDEAKSFLAGVENAFDSQTIIAPKSEPKRVLKYGAERSGLRRSHFKSLLLVVWGYAFAVWLYVVAMQLFYPKSLYWPLATWLPIRLDYFGEAAFVCSFAIATAVTMLNTGLTLRPGRRQPEPHATPST